MKESENATLKNNEVNEEFKQYIMVQNKQGEELLYNAKLTNSILLFTLGVGVAIIVIGILNTVFKILR